MTNSTQTARLTSKGADGRWEYPTGYSGSSFPDPFDRPKDGWDGDPVIWLGETGSTVGDADPPVWVRVVAGMTSREVGTLEVFSADGLLEQVIELRDDTGVFIVGMIGHGTHRIVARNVDGRICRDRLGREINVEFEGEADTLALFKALSESATDSLKFGEITLDQAGGWSIEHDGTDSKITEPDLVEGLQKRFRDPKPWPRNVVPNEGP